MLQFEQFTKTQASAERAREEGIPPRKVFSRDSEQMRRLFTGQRLDLRFRLVASQIKRPIRSAGLTELLVFDRLRKHRAQRAQTAFNRIQL